jgi:hypothetical protein
MNYVIAAVPVKITWLRLTKEGSLFHQLGLALQSGGRMLHSPSFLF